MDFFKWEAKYSVGVEEIDLQHQELFAIINRMIGKLGKASKPELSALLDDMIDYTSFHFQSEEPYYKDHPDYQQHRHEHELFIKKNGKLRQALHESDEDISVEMLNFLLVWLKEHILKTDMRFFKEIKNS